MTHRASIFSVQQVSRKEHVRFYSSSSAQALMTPPTHARATTPWRHPVGDDSKPHRHVTAGCHVFTVWRALTSNINDRATLSRPFVSKQKRKCEWYCIIEIFKAFSLTTIHIRRLNTCTSTDLFAATRPWLDDSTVPGWEVLANGLLLLQMRDGVVAHPVCQYRLRETRSI